LSPVSTVTRWTRVGCASRGARRRPIRCRHPEIRSPLCRRLSGAFIDADDLGDVRPFVAGTNPDFEGFARLHGVDAASSQQAPVEERIARPIREFNEPEAFVRAKPVDDTVDGWTGGCLEPGLAEPGSGAESTRLWVGISVEVATPRMTKNLISQLWFLVGWCPISRIERSAVACCRSDGVLASI
jgi:hypothetical protein